MSFHDPLVSAKDVLSGHELRCGVGTVGILATYIENFVQSVWDLTTDRLVCKFLKLSKTNDE